MINTNYVNAIKNKEDIDRMKKTLINKCFRDYLMFIIGINTGLKVCDLLNLKFRDVMNNGNIKNQIILHGKEYPITKSMSRDLYIYYERLDIEDESRFLFEKGIGKDPIGRSHAYRILNNVAAEVGLKEKVGMHTLRKTYGYHYYKEFRDIRYLQNLFNHSAPSITLKYIGAIEYVESDQAKENFEL